MQAELGDQVNVQEPVIAHYAYIARYQYSDVVVQNDNFLMVSPYSDQYQLANGSDIETRPAGRKVKYSDRHGNSVFRVRVAVPHQELIIAAFGQASLLRPSLIVPDIPMSGAAYSHEAGEFLDASPLVNPGALEEAAHDACGPVETLLEAVNAVTAWVYENVVYERGNTGVGTTAEQVLTSMKGVCQDKAHLALGMLRALGVPARYVSGLLTRQAGETHAWLEFLHPSLGWLPADPTKGTVIETGLNYFKFAVGRDYTEVPPVLGSFVSKGSGQLDIATAQVYFDRENIGFGDALDLIQNDIC